MATQPRTFDSSVLAGSGQPAGSTRQLTPIEIEGLNAASIRRAQGTANPTDIANLDYATTKLGFIPSARVATPTPTASPSIPTPTQQPPTAPSFSSFAGNDPISKFNAIIADMLKSAQGASNNEAIFAQQRALERMAIDRSSAMTPEEERILSPSQQASIRSGRVSALEPEIDAVSARIKAQDSRIKAFETLAKTMVELGENVVKLNPTQETIDSYKNYLKQGGNVTGVPTEIRDKVLSTMTDSDWKSINNQQDTLVDDLRKKYWDAGISLTDTPEVATEKAKQSRIYLDSVRGPVGSGTRSVVAVSPGFQDEDIEDEVRESAVELLGSGVDPQDAYDTLRKRFSPARVSDDAIRSVLGITSPGQEDLVNIPGGVVESQSPIEVRISQLKASGNLKDSDIRVVLRGQFSANEINASSVGGLQGALTNIGQNIASTLFGNF